MTPEQKIEAEAEDLIPIYPIGNPPASWSKFIEAGRNFYIAGRSVGLEREKELEEEIEQLEETIQLGELQNSDLIEKIITKDKEIEALKGMIERLNNNF